MAARAREHSTRARRTDSRHATIRGTRIARATPIDAPEQYGSTAQPQSLKPRCWDDGAWPAEGRRQHRWRTRSTGAPTSRTREDAARSGHRVQQDPPRHARIHRPAARAPGRCGAQTSINPSASTCRPLGASSMRGLMVASSSGAAMPLTKHGCTEHHNPRSNTRRRRCETMQQVRNEQVTTTHDTEGAWGECDEPSEERDKCWSQGGVKRDTSHGPQESPPLLLAAGRLALRAWRSTRPWGKSSEPTERHEA